MELPPEFPEIEEGKFMKKSIDNKLITTVKKLVKLLVEAKYSEIEKWSEGIRLTESEISNSIADYGAFLIFPPSDFFFDLDVIEVKNSKPQKWSIIFPLWTEKDGKSDLTVEITCIKSQGKLYDIEIDNIHVR